MRAALASRARSTPGRLAFSVGGRGVTYGELADQAARLAAALREAGAGPGDRVAIALASPLDFIRVFYATQWLGAAAFPLDPALPADQAARRTAAAGCRLEVRAPALAALDERAARLALMPLRPPAPDAVAYLQLTSGTSGDPRAAVILERNLQATLRGMQELLGFGPADVMAGSIPLHHNFGLVRLACAPVHAGCPCHLTGAPATNVGRWLGLITEVRATVTAAPDYLYRAAALRVDPKDVDIRSLRFASNGGEAVHLDTIRLFEERFAVPGTVRPGYGLTETTLTVSSLAPGAPLRSLEGGIPTCGRAIPGTDIAIGDEDGRALPPGVPGQILVRGPSVFAGYYGDPDGTRRVLRDGWLWTGDQGVMDRDGYLYVTGRQRWMIKRGGAVIVPGEVEEAASGVPGVVRCAAIGIPDGRGGTERLVVLLEVEGHAAEPGGSDAWAALARETAAAVAQAVGHQPNEIVLVEAGRLPLTSSGKVRHGELREIFTAGLVDARLQPLGRFR